jgi:hypothetical protein
MQLKDFQILKEDESSYHLTHPSGRKFTIEKKGLNEKAHSAIKKLPRFACGGMVPRFDDGGEVPDPTEGLEPEGQGAFLNQTPTNNPIPIQTAHNFMDPEASHSAVDMLIRDPKLSGAEAIAQTYATPAAAAVDTAPASPMDPTSGIAFSPPPPAPNPLAEAANTTNGILSKQQDALKNYLGAESAANSDAAKALDVVSDKVAKLRLQNDIAADYKKKDDELRQAYENNTLDPDRYIKNMGTGSKILAAIGIALSGVGSGLSGQKNAALEQINSAIDKDIDAQKNEQSKSYNLWKMNREAMGSDLEANLATQNQLLTGVQVKVQRAALAGKSAEAKLRAAQLSLQLEEQKNQNRLKLAMLQGSGDNGGGVSEADPALLVPEMVPKEHQKEVFDEIKNAQNVSRNWDKILKAFDDAAKENTVIKTGGGLRTPPSVKALHQLLLPNFKSIDGTVRQAAMDETFKNVTPQAGDFKESQDIKRQALKDWMHSEIAAPTAKGFGIDLERFSKTSSNPIARLSPKEREFLAWAKANPKDPRAPLVLKKLGVK